MDQSRPAGFLLFTLSVLTFGFVLSAILLPPDPVTQLLTVPLLLPLAVGVSYWLVYTRGFSL